MGIRIEDEKNVKDFILYKRQITRSKNLEDKNENSDAVLMKDLYDIIIAEVDSRVAEKLAQKSVYYKECQNLRDECTYLRKKLAKCIPIHTIVYLVVNACVFVVALLFLLLFYKYNIYTIKPYFLISACIVSFFLFATALVSIKDWKEYLNE